MDAIEPAMGAVPAVGEHTESILASLGYNQATINSWREGGII
jgi:crotonobetainyl-CoA:carnitine CoA-transferase CaiB-like acyl-CoA transferase